MNSAALALHILSAVTWVGGMFFAYMALRPVAAELLEPPLRLALWARTFARFFPWVWIAVVLLPVTGYWMIFRIYGGLDTTPMYAHAMNAIGTVMILIFIWVFFAPYARLKHAVAQQDWKAGGHALSQIRRLVGINMLLGVTVLLVAGGGRYLAV